MTAALFQKVLFDTQSAMRSIEEYEYARLASNLWWTKIAKTIEIDSAVEIVNFLLSTAMIQDAGLAGGNFLGSEIVQLTQAYEPQHGTGRLKLKLDQWKDSKGKMAIDLATKWAADMGAYMAYWPQKKIVEMLKANTAVGYDSKVFFATDHPLNPKNVGAGTYSNLITDDDYTITASKGPAENLAALQRLRTHIKTIKMPNGVDPRFLRVAGILAGPSVAPYAVEATQAKFMPKVAASGAGAGSSDVTPMQGALGYGEVIEADEFTGDEYDDGAYFVICEQLASSQLGGVVYVNREPFVINYYTEAMIPQLMHANETEHLLDGRNVVGPGHPFLIFKVQPES